jgi:hypothetical protein
MSYETVMHAYYRALLQHDYHAVMKLFSKGAVIEHPIFGTMAAADFFKTLLDRAQRHEITIIDMFSALKNPQRMATYLSAKFTTKDNSQFEEKPIHIFDFTKEGLIEKMIVIIDTYRFRDEYSRQK